jgi:transcriptional antiterminator RfaH
VSTIELDWYLVHTRPRQEEVACEHLERQGYGVYLPRLQLPRRRRGRWHDVVEPLFPRYLFAGMRPGEQSLHPIRSTRGVSALVRGGATYVPVPPGLLEELRAREDATGLHQLSPGDLQPGDAVRILAGPLAGLDAIFQARQGTDRVRVLLTLIGVTAPATLPAGLVVPVRRDRDAAA